jgi:hypothetical protein
VITVAVGGIASSFGVAGLVAPCDGAAVFLAGAAAEGAFCALAAGDAAGLGLAVCAIALTAASSPIMASFNMLGILSSSGT